MDKAKDATAGRVVKKRGFFARFLKRLAKEHEKSGGQICAT